MIDDDQVLRSDSSKFLAWACVPIQFHTKELFDEAPEGHYALKSVAFLEDNVVCKAYVKKDLNNPGSWFDDNYWGLTWLEVVQRNRENRPQFLLYERVEAELDETVSKEDMHKIWWGYIVREAKCRCRGKKRVRCQTFRKREIREEIESQLSKLRASSH